MSGQKIINIGVGVDLDPLKKGMKDGAAIAVSESAKIGEAAASGGDAVDKANKKATASTSNLIKEQREATRAAIALSEKYGMLSKEAVAAAQRAGELKDHIADTKKVIDAFSADSKFTAVAGAMNAAAGSVSIVTGAMGLLGSESDEVQKTLLKVQSAIALTQGVAQLKEMGASFTALSAIINTSVIPSLFTLQGALVATGIGAAAIAIGVLVQQMNAAEAATARAAQAAKDFAESEAAINDATLVALNKNFKTRELQIRAMDDGYEKSAATLELSKQKEIAAAKAEFEASNKLVYDKKRLADQGIAIEEYYQKQVDALRKKYSVTTTTNTAVNKIETKHDAAGDFLAKAVQKSLDASLKQVESSWKPTTIPMDRFLKYDTKSLQEKVDEQLKQMRQPLEQAAVSVGIGIGNAVGAGLATGDFDFSAIMNIVAQLANNLAASMALIGAPLLLVPGMQAQGAAYLAGAAALSIAAGAIGALSTSRSSGSASSGGGGGAVYTGSSGRVAAPSYAGNGGITTPTISMRQYGRDQLLTIDQQGRIKRR